MKKYYGVQNNFGAPDFWGRYLSTVPNASDGLTKVELQYLRSKGIIVVPIFNNFKSSVGDQAGNVAARNAIYNANRLGIRKGTVLFANVERFFEVDANWLIGWVETFYTSPIGRDFIMIRL
ncbi:glycoside hydrolase domain-containing protein [Bacillus sp. EB600]|uniref:glycoside hydrolase domain-containing protein n=1 Tax=Bacillus sp. EB600 TaxID=2806345 RepID=UPI0028113BB4|nr:glycoside hydrolase domain-containing protein [Bacillus sp. EB600]